MRVQRAASRVVLAIITAGYLWAVGYLTLRAQPYGGDIADALSRLLTWFSQRPATAWITFERVEFASNAAMFVPLGALAVLWFGVRLWWLAPLFGFAVSLLIEATQYVFLDSRVADLRDLISNTLGAGIGTLLMLLLAFLLTPPPRRTA